MRKQANSGAIRYETAGCTLDLQSRAPGVVLARYTGWDTGVFGIAPLVDIEQLVPDAAGLELLVDGRLVSGVSLEAARTWARWLTFRRDRLSRVVVLTAQGSALDRMVEHVRRTEALGPLLSAVHAPEAVGLT